MRWHHPTRGLLAPDEFIPLAEQTGLIAAADPLRARRRAAPVPPWQRRRATTCRVAVNLSGAQPARPALPGRGRASCSRAHGVEPTLLELEITESTIMADPSARDRDARAQLRELGVALCDRRLRHRLLVAGLPASELPVDELKIDKSFVARDGDRAPATP